MTYPPLLAHITVRNEHDDFGLWLPLFLVWLLLLAFLLALLPLIIIAAVVLWWLGWGAWAWRAIAGFYGTVCALRGLKVDVMNGENKVYISVV
jgi:hypothetical protein